MCVCPSVHRRLRIIKFGIACSVTGVRFWVMHVYRAPDLCVAAAFVSFPLLNALLIYWFKSCIEHDRIRWTSFSMCLHAIHLLDTKIEIKPIESTLAFIHFISPNTSFFILFLSVVGGSPSWTSTLLCFAFENVRRHEFALHNLCDVQSVSLWYLWPAVHAAHNSCMSF